MFTLVTFMSLSTMSLLRQSKSRLTRSVIKSSLVIYRTPFLHMRTKESFFVFRNYMLRMSFGWRIMIGLLVTIVCLDGTVSFAWIDGQCPCANRSLCQPIQLGPRREKFTFIVSMDNWRSYDYSQLTDRKSTRLNSSHSTLSRMPSSA